MPEKLYTPQDIQRKYNKSTKDKKLEYLWDAIDFMQQYNGRTRFECIVLAMGFSMTSEDGMYRKDDV